jgi:hypothetical protein
MDMIECTKLANANAGADGLERARYFPGQLITSGDLTQDQVYYRERRRLHNRFLHGWGIVCGLEVKKNPLAGAPVNVTVCPGYALSPQGDEIYLATEVQFDLAQCVQGQSAPCRSPCGPVVLGTVDPKSDFYIAVKCGECPTHPVRVAPLGCGCDDTACEYSRIRDSAEVSCLGALPTSYSTASDASAEDLCTVLTTSKVIACPPCPDSPWIVLAKVKLAADGKSIANLLGDDRRLIPGVAAIQEHIRRQCT